MFEIKNYIFLLLIPLTLLASEEAKIQEFAGFVCREDAGDPAPKKLYGSFQGLGKVPLKVESPQVKDELVKGMRNVYCSPVEFKGQIKQNPAQIIVKSIIDKNPVYVSGSVFIVSQIGYGNSGDEMIKAGELFKNEVEKNKLGKLNYVNYATSDVGLIAVVTTALTQNDFSRLVKKLERKINTSNKPIHFQRLNWSSSRGGQFHLKQ